MSKEVSNEEINDKELESPVTDETGESRADEAPGQAQEIEDEEPPQMNRRRNCRRPPRRS